MDNESAASTISVKVMRVLEVIETKGMEYTRLMNLYKNTAEAKNISEFERELVTEKLESVIRSSYPKEGDKLLGKQYNVGSGNKSYPAVSLLEEVYEDIKLHYDLNLNIHKNGVKVGGSMLGGRQYIAWYISYKGPRNYGTSFAYRQDTEESSPVLEVSSYEGSMNTPVTKRGEESSSGSYKEMETFSIEKKKEAILHFKQKLEFAIFM